MTGQFGGGVTSHCFALNGNPAAPCVHGVQGILDAYEKSLLNVGLSGPTNFAPLISTVTQAVQSFHQVQQRALFCDKVCRYITHTSIILTFCMMLLQAYASGLQRYGVLLILTDGQITDMSDTMNAIARAALLPLR